MIFFQKQIIFILNSETLYSKIMDKKLILLVTIIFSPPTTSITLYVLFLSLALKTVQQPIYFAFFF